MVVKIFWDKNYDQEVPQPKIQCNFISYELLHYQRSKNGKLDLSVSIIAIVKSRPKDRFNEAIWRSVLESHFFLNSFSIWKADMIGSITTKKTGAARIAITVDIK